MFDSDTSPPCSSSLRDEEVGAGQAGVGKRAGREGKTPAGTRVCVKNKEVKPVSKRMPSK